MLLAVSDAVGIATVLCSLLGTVFTGIMAYLMARLNTKQTQAAAKVEEVKKELEDTTASTAEKLDDIAKVGESTHTLVNSNMGVQLKISAVALRRVAEFTKHPDDVAAAELSESMLAEHETKQAKVDRSA